MTPELSAIVVSHRSGREASECIRSLRAAFEKDRIAAEILLVDCGSGEGEQRVLETAGADLFLALSENRGYSGGVNAGLARARGRRFLLANADVLFTPGSIAPLLGAIEEGRVGAAAPLAFWDADERIRLPPGFAPGFFGELAEKAAGRWPRLDRRRFASFAREAVRLWESGGAAGHLAGAALAARRDVFDRVGRFDERFPFEYEETEWEDRVRSARLELRYVSSSRVRHLWGVSAGRSPETETRRRASRERYRRERYGRPGQFLLDAVRVGPSRTPDTGLSRSSFAPRPGAWVAFSPNPSRIPFAGAPLDRELRLSPALRDRMSAGRWSFAVFDPRDGRLLETGIAGDGA